MNTIRIIERMRAIAPRFVYAANEHASLLAEVTPELDACELSKALAAFERATDTASGFYYWDGASLIEMADAEETSWIAEIGARDLDQPRRDTIPCPPPRFEAVERIADALEAHFDLVRKPAKAFLVCRAERPERDEDGYRVRCDLCKGHAGDHRDDYHGSSWPAEAGE